ncbi:hypothetical protein GBA52_011338 [Prunus armeniaca]|nr:hypothetical protein GBA52_011338 [Prunus armeniaca]
MAPKKLLDDPPVVEDSDEETVDEETVDEEPEEEDDAVEAEDGKAKSGDDNHDGDEEEGEEDADEEDEDEDEEDNEEKKEKPSSKKALLTSSSAVSNSNPQWPSASEDDSGSGSETESENNSQSPSASDFTVKPIVSKPMNDTVKTNKKNAPAKPAPASNSGSKRPETGAQQEECSIIVQFRVKAPGGDRAQPEGL